jgi:hypothetical protein
MKPFFVLIMIVRRILIMDIKKVYIAMRANFPMLRARLALQFARAAECANYAKRGFITVHEGESGAMLTANAPITFITDARVTFSTARDRGASFGAYPTEYKRASAWNPAYTLEHSTSVMRWCEDTARAGLRFVGFADDIAKLDISGYYTTEDNWSGEILRGAVWQLPARDGLEQYLSGYIDPNNEGAANIDMQITAPTNRTADYFDGSEGARLEAARSADAIAEYAAERERDYNARDQIEQRRDEIITNLESLRDAHSAEIREMRARKNKSAHLIGLYENRKRGEFNSAFLDGAGYQRARQNAEKLRNETREVIKELREILENLS